MHPSAPETRPIATPNRNHPLKYLHHFALIGTALSLACGAAQASPPTIGGDTLLRWLQSKDERDGALAVGYIGGVREVTYQKEHCAGAEAKIHDVVGTIRRVLEGMSKPASMPGSWFITTALNAKWPCPVKKGEAGLDQAGILAKENASPNGTDSIQSSTAVAQGLPSLSVAPSSQSTPIRNSPATEAAPETEPVVRGPTREETEAYIVETVRSCDPAVSGVSLRAKQLEYTSNKTFNYAIDLSKSSVSSSVSAIYFSCTSPGCIELSSGGFPANKHNQTRLNCSYTIAPRLVRAVEHYQTFTGKQKPIF